jgi:hypothetical protein
MPVTKVYGSPPVSLIDMLGKLLACPDKLKACPTSNLRGRLFQYHKKKTGRDQYPLPVS